MAKNDYFVVAYRILMYLYACLKDGEKPKSDYLQADTFECTPAYWEYIISHLYEDGYVEGVVIVPILGKQKTIRMTEDIMITPKGIAYLQENSMMAKAKDFLKGLKETIPGL